MAGRKVGGRGDDQLVPGAAVGRGGVVDAHQADVQPVEVEVESVQVLGSGRGDDGVGVELARGRVVHHAQVVVADVVPAVAGQWVEHVTEAVRARAELHRGRRGRRGRVMKGRDTT